MKHLMLTLILLTSLTLPVFAHTTNDDPVFTEGAFSTTLLNSDGTYTQNWDGSTSYDSHDTIIKVLTGSKGHTSAQMAAHGYSVKGRTGVSWDLKVGDITGMAGGSDIDWRVTRITALRSQPPSVDERRQEAETAEERREREELEALEELQRVRDLLEWHLSDIDNWADNPDGSSDKLSRSTTSEERERLRKIEKDKVIAFLKRTLTGGDKTSTLSDNFGNFDVCMVSWY